LYWKWYFRFVLHIIILWEWVNASVTHCCHFSLPFSIQAYSFEGAGEERRTYNKYS
jgi:hypothetical protein